MTTGQNTTAFARLAHAVAVVCLGLIAGTALAHILEMPHKMGMDREMWFSVQSLIYNGWGIKIQWLAITAMLGLSISMVLHRRRLFWSLLAIALLLVSDVLIFLIWVNPTNLAVDAAVLGQPLTDWEGLRAQWEWGHFARTWMMAAATLSAAMSMPVFVDR